MTNCTFYNPMTGEIVASGTVSEDTLNGYVTDGTPVILDVAASSTTHYVQLDPLAIVAYTEAELAARAGLAPGWVWQMPERIAVDHRATESARAAVIERINAERGRRIAEFDRFMFNGVLYDGDAEAKENINDAAAGAEDDQPLPPGFTWRTFHNADVAMTNADIIEMAKAFRAAANLHKFTMHAIARALKDAAEGDLTNAQLDAINWPG